MINIRIPEAMLKEMKSVVDQGMYSNVNDFIRSSIRDKLEEQRKVSILKSLQKNVLHYSDNFKKKVKKVVESLG